MWVGLISWRCTGRKGWPSLEEEGNLQKMLLDSNRNSFLSLQLIRLPIRFHTSQASISAWANSLKQVSVCDVYLCMNVCVVTYVYVCVCIKTCIYVCAHVYTYIYIHTACWLCFVGEPWLNNTVGMQKMLFKLMTLKLLFGSVLFSLNLQINVYETYFDIFL